MNALAMALAVCLITLGLVLFGLLRAYRRARGLNPLYTEGIQPEFMQENWYEIAGLMETNYWRIVNQHRRLVRRAPRWVLRTDVAGTWAFCRWSAAEFLDMLDRYPADERAQALGFFAALMRAEGYRK